MERILVVLSILPMEDESVSHEVLVSRGISDSKPLFPGPMLSDHEEVSTTLKRYSQLEIPNTIHDLNKCSKTTRAAAVLRSSLNLPSPLSMVSKERHLLQKGNILKSCINLFSRRVMEIVGLHLPTISYNTQATQEEFFRTLDSELGMSHDAANPLKNIRLYNDFLNHTAYAVRRQECLHDHWPQLVHTVAVSFLHPHLRKCAPARHAFFDEQVLDCDESETDAYILLGEMHTRGLLTTDHAWYLKDTVYTKTPSPEVCYLIALTPYWDSMVSILQSKDSKIDSIVSLVTQAVNLEHQKLEENESQKLKTKYQHLTNEDNLKQIFSPDFEKRMSRADPKFTLKLHSVTRTMLDPVFRDCESLRNAFYEHQNVAAEDGAFSGTFGKIITGLWRRNILSEDDGQRLNDTADELHIGALICPKMAYIIALKPYWDSMLQILRRPDKPDIRSMSHLMAMVKKQEPNLEIQYKEVLDNDNLNRTFPPVPPPPRFNQPYEGEFQRGIRPPPDLSHLSPDAPEEAESGRSPLFEVPPP